MKKNIYAIALAISCVTPVLHAEEVKPDNELSFNLGVVNEYRYRGISQSRLDPALQGGADYTNNPTGLYLGTWLSSIKWTKDAGGGGDVEWDIYGGKRGELAKDVSYDVGFLGYVYPSNGLDKVPGSVNANTFEVYGQIGTGPAYAKYSYAVSNLFGFPGSKGSGYLDLGANVDVGQGVTLVLHAGHQYVRNNTAFSYTDWKVGATKEFYGVTLGLAALGTNADKTLYVTPAGKFTGKAALQLSAVKTF